MVTKKDKTVINIANGLSIVRMILGPIFMITVFNGNYLTAFILLLIATLTDFLDGHVARIWNMQTRLGQMLDPVADKVIIFFAIITLLIKFDFPIWIAFIILSRDLIILVGGTIFLYKNRDHTLVPNMLGKITTFFQMTTIVLFIANINDTVKTIFLGFTAIFTLASLSVYMVKGYKLFFKKRKKKKEIINLANKITLSRIVAIPIFIVFLLSDIPFKDMIVALIFIILALSDALDGYIARKRNQITNFGKLVDPLADKLLVSSALIFLIGKGISPWIAYTIIAREFIITGLRMVAATHHQTIAARPSGKVKTFVQVLAITAVLLNFKYSPQLMLTAAIITILSGIEYLWFNRHAFKELV